MSKSKSRTRARPAALRTPAPARREVQSGAEYAAAARTALAPLNLGQVTAMPESELDRETNRLESSAASFVADVLHLAERLQSVVRLSPGSSTETKPLSTATSQLGGRLSDVSERLVAGREVVGRLLETLAV